MPRLSISTTMNIYVHITEELEQTAMKDLKDYLYIPPGQNTVHGQIEQPCR